jgi:hypothetical protein
MCRGGELPKSRMPMLLAVVIAAIAIAVIVVIFAQP